MKGLNNMKKTKTIMLLSLLGLLVTGCDSKPSEKTTEETPATEAPATDAPATETPVVKTPDYFLAGNINLGEKDSEKFDYDEATKTYTLTGISLKRGDAFFINGTDDAAVISFDSLTAKDGFEAGNGHYIKVMNEGIYTLTIKEGALTLTKTGSNYTDVKLVYADGQDAIAFTMKEDFTFAIEDAPLRYRQQFHIEMDGETLGFDSMAFNPAYYKAFRFNDNNIESIKKGLFDITIDFSLSQPLVFTSDEIKEENQAPEDGDAYKKFIKQFSNQFAEEGSKFTSESTVTQNGSITKKTISETLNENQHYIQSEEYSYSADQTAEGAITEEAGKENSAISKKEAVLNSTNYYEIAKYEGSSLTNPSVSGALIKDETENVTEKADEPESTLVNAFERKYLTTEQAKEKVIDYLAEYNHINTILGYFLAHAHITGSSSLTDDAIKDNIKIKSEYIGDIGDAMKIEFSNYEVSASAYGTSYYATNNLVLTLNEDGKIESGEYTMKSYSGSKIVDTSTKLPVDNIEDYLTKTEVYKFSAEYGDRSAVSAFQIPLEDNIASEIETATDNMEISSRVQTLEIKDLGVIAVEPAAPIDLGNYKIMTYDSEFFSKNYNGSLAGKGKIGETTITIGNEYNMVTYDLHVTTVYEAFSTSSQLGNLTVDGKSISTVYVGQSYNFKLTPYAGYDPTDIQIAASSDAVTLSDFNSNEDKKATGAITFKLTVNRAESGVKITYGSKTKPTISTSLSLNITDPWTAEKAAGTYDIGSSYYEIKSLTLNADGTGSVGIGSNDLVVTDNYDFTYDISSTGKISLKTSDHVTALDLEMKDSEEHLAASSGSEKTTHKKVLLNKVEIDNVSKVPSSSYYATFTERLAILCGKFTMKDESGTTYTYVKTEMRTGVYEGVIYFTDGTTTSKFTFKGPSSSYSSYGATASNYYADSTSSSYTSYSGSYTYASGVYTVTFGAKVFTITLAK